MIICKETHILIINYMFIIHKLILINNQLTSERDREKTWRHLVWMDINSALDYDMKLKTHTYTYIHTYIQTKDD